VAYGSFTGGLQELVVARAERPKGRVPDRAQQVVRPRLRAQGEDEPPRLRRRHVRQGVNKAALLGKARRQERRDELGRPDRRADHTQAALGRVRAVRPPDLRPEGRKGCVSLSTKVRKLTISKIRVCVRTHLTFLLSFQHKWLEKSVRFQKKRPCTVQKS